MQEEADRHGIADADTPSAHRWTNDRPQPLDLPNTRSQTCTCGLKRRVTHYPQRPFRQQQRPRRS